MHIDLLILRGKIISENLMSNTLTWLQTGANNLRSMIQIWKLELDYLRLISIQMVFLARILSDLFERMLKLADVYTSSFCVLVQEDG